MALIRKINTKAASDENTGLSTKSSDYAGRFFNKDGQPNVEIKGINFLSRFSVYQIMLEVPLWKFLAFIVSALSVRLRKLVHGGLEELRFRALPVKAENSVRVVP